MVQATQGDRTLDDIGAYLPHGESGSAPVRMVLRAKTGGEVFTVGRRETVYDALCLMAEHNIGALVVVDGGRVAGVVSERDYARKVILIGKTSRETVVEEIMASPAVTVSPEATIAECMALMTRRFVRHLPVIEEDRLVGIVTIGDVVKTLLADQEDRLGRIEAYISGKYPA